MKALPCLLNCSELRQHCALHACHLCQVSDGRAALQGAVTDNAAVLQRRVTKGQNQFLSTLAKDGEAQFVTALKPCGILLPHVHQRANEFYSVVFGAHCVTLI